MNMTCYLDEQYSFDMYNGSNLLLFDLFQELGLSPSVPIHVVLQDWIRHSDGKLSFLGFVRLLHGVSSRSFQKAWENTHVIAIIFLSPLLIVNPFEWMTYEQTPTAGFFNLVANMASAKAKKRVCCFSSVICNISSC